MVTHGSFSTGTVPSGECLTEHAAGAHEAIFVRLPFANTHHGRDATAPEAPALTGYAFSKWDADFTKVTRHILVTAKYNICQFIITFNSNGGTAVSQITEDYNDKVISYIEVCFECHQFYQMPKETITNINLFSQLEVSFKMIDLIKDFMSLNGIKYGVIDK